MQETKNRLGNSVREARLKLGFSQEKLTEVIGIDSKTILNIESGTGNPRLENLLALVDYLHISIDIARDPNLLETSPARTKLLLQLQDLSEQDVDAMIPVLNYIYDLKHQQN